MPKLCGLKMPIGLPFLEGISLSLRSLLSHQPSGMFGLSFCHSFVAPWWCLVVAIVCNSYRSVAENETKKDWQSLDFADGVSFYLGLAFFAFSSVCARNFCWRGTFNFQFGIGSILGVLEIVVCRLGIGLFIYGTTSFPLESRRRNDDSVVL